MSKGFLKNKCYLLNPLVLAVLVTGKTLILYTIALDGSLGALLSEENEECKENTLYYINRTVKIDIHLSKNCLSMVFAVKKLSHYLLSHNVLLISRIDHIPPRPMGPTCNNHHDNPRRDTRHSTLKLQQVL